MIGKIRISTLIARCPCQEHVVRAALLEVAPLEGPIDLARVPEFETRARKTSTLVQELIHHRCPSAL